MNYFNIGTEYIYDNGIEVGELDALLTRYPELEEEVEIFGKHIDILKSHYDIEDICEAIGAWTLYDALSKIRCGKIYFMGNTLDELNDYLLLDLRSWIEMENYLNNYPELVKAWKGWYEVDIELERLD